MKTPLEQTTHDPRVVERIDTLFLLDSTNLPDELDRLRELAATTALRYARAHLLQYSAEHPSRTCTLCAAMGSATLHVDRTRAGVTTKYQFGNNEDNAPAWMEELYKFGHAMGYAYSDWYGPIRIEALAGVVVSDETNW